MRKRKAAVEKCLLRARNSDRIFSFQKMMEAKIMREMEDTKETLQRSKKLITGR